MTPDRPPRAGVLLLGFAALWSGALAAGFVVTAVVGAGRLGTGRLLAFVLVGGFLAAFAAATGRELVRRLRHRG